MQMLRRLNVRTRLVAVIAVPLVLLLAVVVPEAVQRRDLATDADRAAMAAKDIAEVAAAVDAIQGERTLTAALRAGAGPDVERALVVQRATTDDAIARTEGALSALAAADPTVAATTESARQQLAGLAALRQESDTTTSDVPWIDPFAPILDALLQVQESVGSATAGLGVGDRLSAVALIGRSKDAAAAQDAQMAAASGWGELRGEQAVTLNEQRTDEAAYRAAYLAASPTGSLAQRRAEVLAGAATQTGRAVDDVAAGRAPGPLTEWLDQSAARQQVLREVQADRATEALDRIEAVEAASRAASTRYLILAGTGLLLALGLALAAARSITRPLRELTEAADHLATDRLPRLVDAMRHPVDDDDGDLAASIEPIAVRADDEIGQLAHAFNAVQTVAVDVAAEQSALLKKGISDLYVNLARRNQALIDRQIQLLDQLEAEEQDTEVLQHLYLLDHLATRMRRNAESLLILAGSESGPRRSKPIEVVDVVRAALSEVEDYERIELGSVASATLHGPAGSDVAHLVAELLENATQFSPPDTMVRVDGTGSAGGYQLVITDRGVGMRPEQLEELNEVLDDPPVTGLALGRALGLLVAARLAARHGITVRVRAGEDEGVVAYVILPQHLLVDEPREARPARQPGALTSRPTTQSWPLDWEAEGEAPEPDEARRQLAERPPAPVRLSDALPARSEFDAGIQALLDREGEPTLVEPPIPTGVPAAAVAGDDGSARLRRRVPGATAEAIPEPIVDPPVRRDPDEVRARLSRYRSGLHAGRVSDGLADEEPS
jgi:signal transduction histidine kinase